jgi:hypothetical protein
MSEYEIAEVRVEGDTVLIVLSSEEDGFGVEILYSKLLEMSEQELDKLLQEKIIERATILADIEKTEKDNEEKRIAVEHLKGRKIKLPVKKGRSRKK